MNLDDATPTPTDVVLIDTLHLPAGITIGPDAWSKTRPQPATLSVYLHLTPLFLVQSGESDRVEDSVHYGVLTKRVAKLVSAGGDWEGKEDVNDAEGQGKGAVEQLLISVAREAVDLGGKGRVREVRLVLTLPKIVLLAEGGLTVDSTLFVSPDSGDLSMKNKRVEVKGLALPVLIGVNPPERLAKQRVVTDLAFYEGRSQGTVTLAEYKIIVDEIVKVIDASSYLTLEKFVHEIARSAFKTSNHIDAITVKSRKPSALSFADYSGVEVTRRRIDFGL